MQRSKIVLNIKGCRILGSPRLKLVTSTVPFDQSDHPAQTLACAYSKASDKARVEPSVLVVNLHAFQSPEYEVAQLPVRSVVRNIEGKYSGLMQCRMLDLPSFNSCRRTFQLYRY